MTVSTDVDHPEEDARWNNEARDETEAERLDRNWADLLQELRVVQTGVQLLTAFLLTVPFQQRFTALSDYQRGVYLVAVSLSAAATALLVAPVSTHRMLFRQHARRAQVSMAHRFATAGVALLGLAISCVLLLIFDVVVDHLAGVIACVAAATTFLLFWFLIPLQQRMASPEPNETGTARDHS